MCSSSICLGLLAQLPTDFCAHSFSFARKSLLPRSDCLNIFKPMDLGSSDSTKIQFLLFMQQFSMDTRLKSSFVERKKKKSSLSMIGSPKFQINVVSCPSETSHLSRQCHNVQPYKKSLKRFFFSIYIGEKITRENRGEFIEKAKHEMTSSKCCRDKFLI